MHFYLKASTAADTQPVGPRHSNLPAAPRWVVHEAKVRICPRCLFWIRKGVRLSNRDLGFLLCRGAESSSAWPRHMRERSKRGKQHQAPSLLVSVHQGATKVTAAAPPADASGVRQQLRQQQQLSGPCVHKRGPRARGDSRCGAALQREST